MYYRRGISEFQSMLLAWWFPTWQQDTLHIAVICMTKLRRSAWAEQCAVCLGSVHTALKWVAASTGQETMTSEREGKRKRVWGREESEQSSRLTGYEWKPFMKPSCSILWTPLRLGNTPAGFMIHGSFLSIAYLTLSTVPDWYNCNSYVC